MPLSRCSRSLFSLGLAVLAANVLVGGQQTQPPETKPPLPGSTAPIAPQRARALEGREMETDTPLGTVHKYLDAFNRGDAKAMARPSPSLVSFSMAWPRTSGRGRRRLRTGTAT